MNLEEEWHRELQKFQETARALLEFLATRGHIPIIEDLFKRVYNDIGDRLVESRGWWNPLLSPYTVYHFYDHAILILSPASSEKDFLELHGIPPGEVVSLVKENLLTVLLGAPHTSYTCECYDEILRAQGSLPTILRITESLKAVQTLLGAEDQWIYNTKYLLEFIRGVKGLEPDTTRDLATRISDLAALGYVKMAKRLLQEITRANDSRHSSALIRALHHVLVEPIIDSGATIGIYSEIDVDFIKKIAGEASEIALLLEKTLWSFGTSARIRVPRKFSMRTLQKLLEREDTIRVHEAIREYRRILQKLSREMDLREAREIAALAASETEVANRAFRSEITIEKSLLALGFVAQLALNILLEALDNPKGIMSALIVTALSLSAEPLIRKRAKRLLEKLLTVEEHILVTPVMPMILETTIF